MLYKLLKIIEDYWLSLSPNELFSEASIYVEIRTNL